MASELTALQPLWAAGDAWLRRAEQVITDSAEALNTLNVFPVPDADTGSNLALTLSGIVAAVPVFDDAHLDEVVQAAILSAHGNSGAILAEMLSSVCRALVENRRRSWAPDGLVVARLLRMAATAATEAVATPVAGTILTVADQAAAAAERAATGAPRAALTVAVAAQHGARSASSRTRGQLDVLARAGVVDAGGQAFVLLVDVLVEVLGGPVARPLEDVAPPTALPVLDPQGGTARSQFEVMYAVRGANKAALDGLRTKLSELGHSVLIVGDQSVAQVHVHLEEPGAAVEAALGLGRLSQVRIVALHSIGAAPRALISVVAGEGLAEAVRTLGGLSVPGGRGAATLAELSAVLTATDNDVVVLPNDMESLEMASHLATPMRSAGRRVAVIPTVAQVQGLAAIAVHEPTMDFDSAVVAMSTAAGHTRQGAVTIAESAAMTMAGRCRVGDVLGLVEGDFVVIGDALVEVAWEIIQRLLAAGGDLVTLVAGAGAQPELLAELEQRLRGSSQLVDVETLIGGQPRYPLLIGVE